ncbi:MAG: glutathione S-transferase family protein [Enterobacterales bacterium]|nr:glutathione S-transferase family protein [Enterobacterales bacterium]
MELYGMGKSRSFRALWALEEAGIEYEYVAVEFASNKNNGAQSDAYRALNPQGKVPTLVDEELVLTESGAILNYIASSSSNLHLIPSNDLKLRAKYDEACYFILTELEQGLWTNGKHRFALPEERRVPDILPTADWEFNKAIKALQTFFDGEDYLVGDEFTMADVLLAHTLNWAESFKFTVPEKLLTYKNKMYYRTACKKSLSVIE